MRLYSNSEKMTSMLQKVGMQDDEEIAHPWLNRSIETAQKRVEQHHYQMRRRTLEYDDVMNKQREQLYGFRNEIIRGEDVRDRMFDIVEEVVIDRVLDYIQEDLDPELGLDYRGLSEWVNQTFPVGLSEQDLKSAAEKASSDPQEGSVYDGLSKQQFALCQAVIGAVQDIYDIKVDSENDEETLASQERYTILTSIDRMWREHLYAMDGLRQSVHLRSYGQKDPLVEYKTEARDMFQELMRNIKDQICRSLFMTASSLESVKKLISNLPTQASHAMASAFGFDPSIATAGDMVSEANAEVSNEVRRRPDRVGPKVGRNDPCPCGSGKKYKKCCGR